MSLHRHTQNLNVIFFLFLCKQASGASDEEARLYDGTFAATRSAPARLVLVIAPPLRVANMLACPIEYRLFSRRTGLRRSGTLPREAETHMHAFHPSHPVELTPFLR